MISLAPRGSQLGWEPPFSHARPLFPRALEMAASDSEASEASTEQAAGVAGFNDDLASLQMPPPPKLLHEETRANATDFQGNQMLLQF